MLPRMERGCFVAAILKHDPKMEFRLKLASIANSQKSKEKINRCHCGETSSSMFRLNFAEASLM